MKPWSEIDDDIVLLKAENKRLSILKTKKNKTIRALRDLAEELKRCGNCKYWGDFGCEKQVSNYHDRSSAASNCEHWELHKRQAGCREYAW